MTGPLAASISTVRRLYSEVASSRVARGTLVLQLGGGAQRLLALASHVLVARLLGVDVYGSFALVTLLAAALPFIFDLGVRRTVLTRFAMAHTAGNTEAKVGVLVFAIKASLAAATATLVVGAPLLWSIAGWAYGDVSLGVWAWTLCWGQLFYIPPQILSASLEAARRMPAVQALDFAGESIRFLAVVIAYMAELSLPGLVIVLLLSDATRGGLGLLALTVTRRVLPNLLPDRDLVAQGWKRTLWSHSKSELRFGLLSSVAKRCSQLVLLVVPLLIGASAGKSEVGLFRIAWTLASVPAWWVASLSRNLLPALAARNAEGDGRGIRRILRLSLTVGGVSASVAAVALGLSARWLIDLIYGTQFGGAVPVVHALLSYIVVVGLGVAHESVYLVRSDLRALNLRSVVGAAAVVAIAPFCILRWGAVGGAISLAVGAVLILFFDGWRVWLRSWDVKP